MKRKSTEKWEEEKINLDIRDDEVRKV